MDTKDSLEKKGGLFNLDIMAPLFVALLRYRLVIDSSAGGVTEVWLEEKK